MSAFIYNSEDNTVREKATVEQQLEYVSDITAGKKWRGFLRQYPCTPNATDVWKHGQEVVEWEDFAVVNKVNGKGGFADLINKPPSPLPTETGEDGSILDEVVGICIKAYTYYMLNSIEDFNNEMSKLKSYTITKKQ